MAAEEIEAREGVAVELTSQIQSLAATTVDGQRAESAVALLERCKVFMRDRRGIEALLTVEVSPGRCRFV